MKKKSQIELFMPINEDIAGQHRTNKDVNNADDSEGIPRKSFTDDDFLDDNLTKEALGLFDIPAGAPDGAQNFRGRGSYKEEDFEASNKTGFGGESVIDIDEDEHPINIQRRDEFNSANNNENRKKDFFSFLGFKSTGRSMNKELEKLASVLNKSGYPEVSNEITKVGIAFLAPLLAVPLKAWAAGAIAGSFYDWSTNNSDLLERIDADQDNSVEEIYEKFKLYLRNYDLVYGLGEWPKGQHADGLKLVGKLQKKFDKGQTITESEFEKMCDSITEDDINFFDDEVFFVNAHNEILKLKQMAIKADKEREKNPDAEIDHEYTMGDKYKEKQDKKRSKKEKEEKEALTKAEQDKRDKAKEEALANAKIVESWYEPKFGKTLGRDEFGRIQEQDIDPPYKFRFIDGYPGAKWEVAFDEENRKWKACPFYKVMMFETSPGSGKFENYPFKGSGSKSASIGVNTKMIKKAISKRDNIIKHASKLKKDELDWFNYGSNPRKSREDINSPAVLRAMADGPAAVEALWQRTLPQIRAHETAYNKANTNFWNSVKYDPGIGSGGIVGKFLPSNVRNSLAKSWSWWNVKATTGLTKARMTKAVKDALDEFDVERAGKGGFSTFDIKQSNFTFLEAMSEQQKAWQKNDDFYLDAYWAVKIMGGSTNRNVVDGRDIPNYPPPGKDGLPVYPLGPIETKARGGDGTLIATDSAGFKDENGDSKYGYEKDFYWVCTVKGAKKCRKWALLGTYQPADVGWGFDKTRNKSILMKKDNNTWYVWNGNSWQRLGKKASLSNRDKRLIKSGMKKDSIRSRRLKKVAQDIELPKDGVKADGTNNNNNNNRRRRRRGTGGGGTCGVTIQANLNKSLFHQGRATQAQELLLEYQPIGKADGNWGECSHSGWLLFLDALDDLGAKSPEYKDRIPAYVSGLRRKRVTLDVVRDAIEAWTALGGRSGAAASVAPASWADVKSQVAKGKQDKLFTDDLLIKYLLGEYDKKDLLHGTPVGELILDYCAKILKPSKRASGLSIFAKLPPGMKKEFTNLFGLPNIKEGETPGILTWDWTFLKYKIRGGYILHNILGQHRELVISALKKELCGGVEKECSKMVIDDLKAQPKPESNIPLMSAISAAGAQAERAARKADASGQANIASIASAMFTMPDVANDSLISLMKPGTYIATNGALITHDSDMADMVTDNQKAGKIDAVWSDIIIAAGDKLKSKIFADRKLLAAISDILKRVVKDGKVDLSGAVLEDIDRAVAQAHRGKKNWRDGYIFEQIISNKSMLKETDSRWWDLGIGVDSRQDIIKKYREMATDPLNKRVERTS